MTTNRAKASRYADTVSDFMLPSAPFTSAVEALIEAEVAPLRANLS